jgi:hypothetical protein
MAHLEDIMVVEAESVQVAQKNDSISAPNLSTTEFQQCLSEATLSLYSAHVATYFLWWWHWHVGGFEDSVTRFDCSVLWHQQIVL